jgi:hypothetical protein
VQRRDEEATVDEQPAPGGVPEYPYPPAPPSGWSASPPPPPPPQWGGGQWPPPPLTTEQRKRTWDTISFGLGGGALYFGIGGLVSAGIAWALWKAPITSQHTGVQATVDRTFGHLVLDLFAIMFAMIAIAGGLVGGIAGLGGLVTRKVTLAALSTTGLAAAAASFGLGWYILAGISSWHR